MLEKVCSGFRWNYKLQALYPGTSLTLRTLLVFGFLAFAFGALLRSQSQSQVQVHALEYA